MIKKSPMLYLILLASLCLTSAFITLSWQRAQAHLNQWQAASTANQATHVQFTNLVKERATILQTREAYQALVTHGIVGLQTRVEWIDAIQNARQQAGIARLDYEIMAQENIHVVGSALILKAPAQWRQSMMRIKLELLHENELLTFFTALDAQQRGLYAVRSCELHRINVDAALQTPITLRAECLLHWYTFIAEAKVGAHG